MGYDPGLTGATDVSEKFFASILSVEEEECSFSKIQNIHLTLIRWVSNRYKNGTFA